MVPRSPGVVALLSLTLLGAVVAWYRQPSSEPSAGGWIRLQAMPTPRSEMPAALLGDTIYVPGGLGASGRTLSTLEAYDVDADEWRVLEPLPLPLHHTAAVGVGGRVLVAGGYTDLEFRSDNSAAWAFDPTSGSWERIADMPAPRAAHALVEIAGLVYAVGGAGPRSEELWAYDPSADSWRTDLAAMPTPREHLTAVAIDGLLYAIGGRVGRRNLAVVEVYDPATDSWTSAPPVPTARSGHGAAVVAGEIHVAGGEDLAADVALDSHEVFDPVAGQWRVAVPLPSPRHGLASAGAGGRWYLIGGAEEPGARTFVSLTDAVAALHVDPSR
ncbi:MAG TPA: kelch repeat-containing protein [Trueperaceae bacterium]